MNYVTAVGLALAAMLAAGCGKRDILDVPEIPTISVGGGAPAANGNSALPAGDQYEEAYAGLRKQHLIVTRDINVNAIAVREALDRILASLQLMRSLIEEPEAGELAATIGTYEGMREAFVNRRHSSATINQFERTEQEVRTKFAPGRVRFVAASAVAATPNQPTAAPVVGPKVMPGGGIPVAGNDVPLWVFTHAWEKANGDLLDRYRDNKEGCAEAYRRVMESLQYVNGRLKSDDAEKLQIYLHEYERIHRTTGGFTRLPEKATREDVQRELEAVTKVVRQMLPEKKA